ncbi:MAG: glutaredoxin family protein [Chloroflexi bacterium]|nr:glutaredoxin family protein [Chloroflexota bacterium]
MTQETATIVVYTHPDCQGCDMVLDDLDRRGVRYRQIDVTTTPGAVEALLKLTDGQRVTPVVVDGDKVSIGYRGIGCTF